MMEQYIEDYHLKIQNLIMMRSNMVNGLKNIGQTTSRPQFTSTSVSRDIAESFALADDYSALLKIESKNGKWLNGLSEVEKELEVLFKSDSLFEITKIETIIAQDRFKDGFPRDIVQITMKEI